MLLRYFFGMGRLSKRAQWTVIIGGVIGFRVLRQVARTNPSLAAWIWPVLIAYVVFVFLTWTAESLSNLLLRRPVRPARTDARRSRREQLRGRAHRGRSRVAPLGGSHQ